MNSFRARLNDSLANVLSKTGVSKELLLSDVSKDVLAAGAAGAIMCGAVTMSTNAYADTAVVPAVAETPGAHNSYWDTSLQVFNPNSTAVNATLTLYKSGNAGTFTTTTQIQPGSTANLEKILTTMGTTGSGALVITTPDGQKLLGEARLFNEPKNGTGTQGQNLPLYQLDELLNATESGSVFLGRNTASTRSNHGWYQHDAGTAKHDLVNAQGQTIASLTETYAANTHIQREAGAMFSVGLTDNCRVVSSVQSGRGISYASEVDNTSQDATTKQMQRVTTNNPDTAAAYVNHWLPRNDSGFYLANHEIRAMINGASGVESYSRDLAEQFFKDPRIAADLGSVDAVEQWLKDRADGSTSTPEFCTAFDPFAWTFGVGSRTYGGANCNPVDFQPGNDADQIVYSLAKEFLTSYVGTHPQLYGGQAGGVPSMDFNPTWNDQDPN